MDNDLRLWPDTVYPLDQLNVRIVILGTRHIVVIVLVVSTNVDDHKIRGLLTGKVPSRRIISVDLSRSP
jgi:hypothetical protein